MNLYLRYFDKETLVDNIDDALSFLCNIPEIAVTPELEDDLRRYHASDVLYPKRYKVRPRIYFIVIKTEAETMNDFKQKKAMTAKVGMAHEENIVKKEDTSIEARANDNLPGWYEGSLEFKRVVLIPETGKYEYRDTHFVADCKATSYTDCYDRIVRYLKGRVDGRSQFPSVKGKNFKCKFLGAWK